MDSGNEDNKQQENKVFHYLQEEWRKEGQGDIIALIVACDLTLKIDYVSKYLFHDVQYYCTKHKFDPIQQ